MDINSLKRTLRELKRLEILIRFSGRQVADQEQLVWSRYFTTRSSGAPDVPYPMDILMAMEKDSLKGIFDEYFTAVYAQYYRELGIGDYYDQRPLAALNLPPDAGLADIKRRFRQLAKEYHPDLGGDSAKFIALMETYRKLLGELPNS